MISLSLPAKLSSRWVALLFMLTFIPLIWSARFWAININIENLQSANQTDLFRFTSALSATLNKHESIPHLLSLDPRLKQLLNDSANPLLKEQINHYLELVNRVNGTAAVYLMDQQGKTLAASNWQTGRSFVGKNFSFRPYFQQSMEGRIGHYYALGKTSHKRGYYISAPISDADEIIGVVVVKVSFSDIENQWKKPEKVAQTEIIVTDPDGVIFISTHSNWLFQSFIPLSRHDRSRIVQSQRYPNAPIAPLNVSLIQLWTQPPVEVNPKVKWINIGNNKDDQFYSRYQDMPNAQWRVYALTRLDEYQQSVWLWIITTTVVFILIMVIVLFILEHIRHEQELVVAKNELEQRVQDRTQDLEESNQQLRQKASDQKKTEGVLRNTQDQLIQAAKMAVMGQMSAGINHELNQPLTAIRSYAQNSLEYLNRQNPLATEENLYAIIDLTDHMSAIIAQLKVFARKGSRTLHPVNVEDAVKAATKILASLLKEHKVELDSVLPDTPLFVLGDLVQLEQVFINLISNACQAVKHSPVKSIHVQVEANEEKVYISVSDTGTGIHPNHLATIFSPFFTTSGVSEGLGLGLSITQRIIEQFQGDIQADNAARGGAVFSLWLPRYPEQVTE